MLALNGARDAEAALAAFMPLRAALAADLNDGADTPALFWEALRGELIALMQSGRTEAATTLHRSIRAGHPGAPPDLPASSLAESVAGSRHG